MKLWKTRTRRFTTKASDYHGPKTLSDILNRINARI